MTGARAAKRTTDTIERTRAAVEGGPQVAAAGVGADGGVAAARPDPADPDGEMLCTLCGLRACWTGA